MAAHEPGRDPTTRADLAAFGVAVVAVACCAGLPLLAALAGGVALGSLLGVGAGLLAALGLGAGLAAWARRRRGGSPPRGAHPRCFETRRTGSE